MHTHPLPPQETSPYAFRNLIDVLRLHKLYKLEDVGVPVRDTDKGDFNLMLSFPYPACETLINISIK